MHQSVGQTSSVQFPVTYVVSGVETWDTISPKKQKNVPYFIQENPGVYEVWHGEVERPDSVCLYVGNTDNLYKRVHNELVGGAVKNDLSRGEVKESHAYRREILKYARSIQPKKVLWVRWSECESYNLVELYLHQLYQPLIPDQDLVNSAKEWSLDLSMQGKPWGLVAQWLRSKGYQI